MNITTIHHGVPKTVSKGIIKSMIGSLNATVIAYARMHLRYNAKPIEQDGVPTIDKFNDEMAALDEQQARDKITAMQGFNAPMPTAELIDRLMALRNYFVERLMQMKDSVNDVPLSIAETLKFQCERTPDSNDALIAMLAEAVEMDPATLKAAQVKMLQDDAADLRANAGKISDFLTQFIDEDFSQEDHEVESNFAALPAHVAYKLYVAAYRAHGKASQRAMISLLRGKLDAAGDIRMLKATQASLLEELSAFRVSHQVELDAYVERGGSLPEVEDREIVVSNAIKAKEAKAEAEAPAEAAPVAPSKPSMRRAPKPEQAAA